MKARFFATALWLACSAATAAEDERGQIAAERRTIEARHAAEQRACRERFAVTACLDDSRARRRAELAPLRERELRLDDAQRQARAQERREAVAAKQAAAASHAAASQPAAAAARPARAPASAPAHPDRGVRPRDNGAAQAAEAADRARAAERRREAARQTQDRVARRLAERAAQGKKVEPLPVPGAAASAAR